MNRTFIVLDTECDYNKPVDICNVVQIAALAIDPIKLTLIPNSKFNIHICPPDIDNNGYFELHEDTINFHAKNQNIQPQDIIKQWKEYIDEKTAWQLVVQYFKRWNPKNDFFHNPIAVGANLHGFDLPIIKRINAKYGITKDLFWLRDTVDVQHLCWEWLHFRKDCPNNFKMDTLRPYFGMSNENAHDAMQDVEDTAKIFIRFIKWMRELSEKQTFKGKMKGMKL